MFFLHIVAVIVGLSSLVGASLDDLLEVFECELPVPPFPLHGSYVVEDVSDPKSGVSNISMLMNVTCDPGYGLVGKEHLSCLYGWWSEDFPKCVRYCEDKEEYTNIVSCGKEKECVLKDYIKLSDGGALRSLPNIDKYGDCGRQNERSVESVDHIIGGRFSKFKEMPWHAAVYRKTTTPYMQICGGTIVSRSVVISAAHCFWSDVDKIQPASNYAIAAGKLFRPWNHPKDEYVQKSDVKDIKIPPRFQGGATNYQDDLAVVIIESPFYFTDDVRPICLDFDHELDDKQLSVFKYGMVAGWGLTEEDGRASPVLKVVAMPYVAVEECLAETPTAFKSYITSDKICAGFTNGTAVCRGDSGGGLVFTELVNSVTRYFLRGVVSTAPVNGHKCNAFDRTTFTQIVKHEDFIKKYLI